MTHVFPVSRRFSRDFATVIIFVLINEVLMETVIEESPVFVSNPARTRRTAITFNGKEELHWFLSFFLLLPNDDVLLLLVPPGTNIPITDR